LLGAGFGATPMMGHQGEDRAKLFYEFCLEDRVPVDHLLRKIDRFLDLCTLRQELAPFYSTIGRPSIDPELMIRILVVGYCLGIRSERRLCEEIDLNLAYRWFCGWDWKAAFPTIRPSPRPAMAVSATVTLSAVYSRWWYSAR
jgi:transposase